LRLVVHRKEDNIMNEIKEYIERTITNMNLYDIIILGGCLWNLL